MGIAGNSQWERARRRKAVLKQATTTHAFYSHNNNLLRITERKRRSPYASSIFIDLSRAVDYLRARCFPTGWRWSRARVWRGSTNKLGTTNQRDDERIALCAFRQR